MQSFEIIVGADVRAYATMTFAAESKEDAIKHATALLYDRMHQPERLGFKIDDERGSEIQGEVTLTADPDDDDSWIDIPTPDGNPNYNPLLEIVRQLARMDPPDERQEIDDIDGEIEAFSHMIRKAKEIMGEAPAPAAPVRDASDILASIEGEIAGMDDDDAKACAGIQRLIDEFRGVSPVPAERDILDWSGPEEGDTCDLSVWITDDCGNELYEITEGGDVESNKDIARRVVESINAIRTTGGGITIEQATALVPEYVASVAAEGR